MLTVVLGNLEWTHAGGNKKNKNPRIQKTEVISVDELMDINMNENKVS